MNRSSVARRYAPLAAVAALQLLIIAVVPSKAPSSTLQAAGGGGAFQPGAAVGGGSGATGDAAGGTADTIAGGATTGAGGATTGATTAGGGATSSGGAVSGGGGGGTSSNSGPQVAAGDTSHCVDGRQFDPKIDFYAPPCVPKWAGGNNGGATFQGVTADTIKIVEYYPKGNAQVDTILKAQDAYMDINQVKTFDKAVEKYMNDRYELYGRKISIEVVQGNCETIPPDEKCLRSEMAGIVRDKKPYFFMWNTSLASQVFDELSQRQTPNIGGWHFREEFATARAPYHWDVQMTYTRMHKHFAEWYCKTMQGPAKYGGTNALGQSVNGKPRVLGVIGTADPENIESMKTLRAELAKCGAKIAHEYHYVQDISTAEQQRKAAVSKMREAPESTTILCVCDLVAPTFLYEEESEEAYFPENVLSGSGFMDADPSGQSYGGTLGCPTRTNCAFENAFGLSSIDKQDPPGQDFGARVWKLGGGQGAAPGPAAVIAQRSEYWSAIGWLIQAAGPQLTPQNMEVGAGRYGSRGGGTTGHPKRAFGPGNHGWNQDMRMVYWSTKTVSPYNNKAGSFVQVGPTRYDLGEYPSSPFTLPGKPR